MSAITRPPVHVARVLSERVGVDSGTMCLSRPEAFVRGFDLMVGLGHDATADHADGVVVCTSGHGDGEYQVLHLLDGAERIVGVEVVFLTPEIDAVSNLGPAHETAEEHHARLDDLIENLLVCTEPDGGIEVGRFSLDGRLWLGDPCYFEPTLRLDVAPGEWHAVVYLTTLPGSDVAHASGRSVTRIGLYHFAEALS